MSDLDLSSAFFEDGYVSAVPVIGAEEAASLRQNLEDMEKQHGSLHYKSKIHTLHKAAADLATDPRVLDAVEQILGPDIMLFDVTYIIKEAHNPAMVSWHQDLTYWGFSDDKQVSMWLALSPATEISGCMRMIPGSHKNGMVEHVDVEGDNNILHRGQRLKSVSEEDAVLCPLQPGEASFHHGWTMHASMPNESDDRRIGLNAQFITPDMKQLVNKNDTAKLVRGVDKYGYYVEDALAINDFTPDAIAHHAEMDRIRKETWEKAS